MSGTDRDPMVRRRLTVAGILGASIVVLGGAAWFGPGVTGPSAPSAAMTPPPPAVGVQAVTTRGVSRSFEFAGRIEAVNKVELRARIEGFLDKVLLTEGQDVRAGDMLYRIEKVQFQAAVDQAEGSLQIAEATETNARLDYNRHLSLAKRQYTPQSVLDRAKADLESAIGKVKRARAALTRAQADLDYVNIRSEFIFEERGDVEHSTRCSQRDQA